MWSNGKNVIWRPWAMFPFLFLEILLGEDSKRQWTLQPWQSTKDRCQTVIPGNKWNYICCLFDSEWSLGKYERSLLVCALSANLTIYSVVLASLHTCRQTELIDCHIYPTALHIHNSCIRSNWNKIKNMLIFSILFTIASYTCSWMWLNYVLIDMLFEKLLYVLWLVKQICIVESANLTLSFFTQKWWCTLQQHLVLGEKVYSVWHVAVLWVIWGAWSKHFSWLLKG